jgi:hypothetical protein
MSRKGFAAALLLAVVPARAQLEVRPALGVPSAPAVLALAPSAAIALSPISAPSAALAAPSLPTPVLAAATVSQSPASVVAAQAAALPAATPPTARAHAAAMGGAIADFTRLDLSAASAGDARGAGDALMLRALGAAPDGPAAAVSEPDFPAAARALAPASPARASGARTYLLSRPLRETVTLGPVSLAAHVLYEVAWESFKAWLTWKATHSPAAVAVLLLVETPASPAMITVRSLLDLGQRYWRRKLAVLRELARTPGVERVRVLTTGEVQFLGPVARRKDNMGLIFVESSAGLPDRVGRFGPPIPIEDAESQRVRLTLVSTGKAASAVWSPSLSHLLEGRPIPSDVAAAWRAAISPGKAPIKLLLGAANGSSLRVDAALLGPDGSEKPLGSIAEGPAVRTLIGLGRLDRARAWVGWQRAERRLPVSETTIERPSAAREAGAKAALSRAWRRLTGRLIAG